MNEFLNLELELDFGSYELRDLLDGRNAIESRLRELDAADPETGDEFDGLSARLAELEPVIDERETESRRRDVQSRIQRRNQGNGQGNRQGRNRNGQRGNVPASNPLGSNREEERDILSPESLANYSVLRGLRSMLNGRIDGFEAEVQQELEQRRGASAEGLLIPWNLPARRSNERRDIGSSNAASLIPTITAPTMIDVLRNRMAVVAMGGTVLDDMVGNFEIPKKTATSAAYWVAEGSAPTESTPTTGQVAFSPETVGTFVDITRRLLKQTSFAAEQIVRDDIFAVLSIELDRVGLNGSGSSNQPEGILQNSSVPTVAIATDGGALTWAKVVEMETEVADDNADVGSLGYVFTPKGRGHLKTKEKATGTGQFIWRDDNTVNGYRAMASKQLPDNLNKGATVDSSLSAAIFGNWADAVYALWGGIDITVDTATLSTSGGVRLVGLADADFHLRRNESFSKCVDIDSDA